MAEPLDRPERLREGALALPPEVRLALLRAILSPPDDRAETIGRLWQVTGGGQTAGLLIDLEDDRVLALDVADALKLSFRD